MSETRDGDNSSSAAKRDFEPATAITTGTSANQADRWLQDINRTLTSTNSENLDVYDWAGTDHGPGAGRDQIGNLSTLAEVVGIMIVNETASVGNLRVGALAATTAWVPAPIADDEQLCPDIFPGGFAFFFNPPNPAWPVADVTSHLLKFNAPSGNVTYSVYILGRSA